MARNPGLLFHANPPKDEALLRDLFEDREAELEQVVDVLRAEALPTVPLSIHGPTRSGKSHFARLAVLEAIAQGAAYDYVLVQASDRSTPRRVLIAMYTQLLDRMPQFPSGYDRDATESWQRELDEFHRMRPLIEDPEMKVEEELGETSTSSRSHRLGFSLAPSITLKTPAAAPGDAALDTRVDLKAEALAQRDAGHGESRKVKGLRALPTDDHVVAWIDRLLDFRRRVSPTRRPLFLVDDLDFLDAGQENSPICAVLVDKLVKLAETGRCVVVTARSPANTSLGKDLHPLMEIGPWPDAARLLAVYETRIKALNEGEAVFDPEAIRWLAARVDGSVGIFLQHCDEVAKKFARKARPITLPMLKQRLRDQFEEWRRGHPDLVFVLGRVEETARRGQIQVEFETELPPNSNPTLLRLLTKLHGRPRRYAISPLFLHALRDDAP